VEDAGRPNLALMAGGGRSCLCLAVCLLCRRRRCAGALGSSPVSGQRLLAALQRAAAERLLSGRRWLLSGERRLLFGGRRPAGLRLQAGEGARARERRPGGVEGMCWLLRVVRVRGLGQSFHGPTGRYGPICCETFQPTYRVFFFF
jgi:hypothetical protein